MQKKYVELKNNRVAILKYNFVTDIKSELFNELSEDAIIPDNLYFAPEVEVLLLSEKNNAVINRLNGDDIIIIHNAIKKLVPEKITAKKYKELFHLEYQPIS